MCPRLLSTCPKSAFPSAVSCNLGWALARFFMVHGFVHLWHRSDRTLSDAMPGTQRKRTESCTMFVKQLPLEYLTHTRFSQIRGSRDLAQDLVGTGFDAQYW